MPAKAVDARKHITRNHRPRGHGPLLQEAWPVATAGDALRHRRQLSDIRSILRCSGRG